MQITTLKYLFGIFRKRAVHPWTKHERLPNAIVGKAGAMFPESCHAIHVTTFTTCAALKFVLVALGHWGTTTTTQ